LLSLEAVAVAVLLEAVYPEAVELVVIKIVHLEN
jgi:hypothetical protein